MGRVLECIEKELNVEALAKSHETGFSTDYPIISDRVPNYLGLNVVIDTKRLIILYKKLGADY